MSKLLDSGLEQMVKFENGCIALYYDATPTREQVIADLKSVQNKYQFSVDLSDPYFGYDEVPTKISAAAGWKRYECYPVG